MVDTTEDMLGMQEDMAEDSFGLALGGGGAAFQGEPLQPGEKLADADFFNQFYDDFNEQDMVPQ